MKTVNLSDQVIRKLQPLLKDSTHRHKIISSGRAGTKSSALAILAVLKILRKVPGSVVMIRKRHNKLRKTVFREVKRAISRLKLSGKKFKITVNPMQITYLPTGNTIYFVGSDNSDDTKGIIDDAGRPICTVIIDEVSDFFLSGNGGADEIQNIEATFIRGNDNDFQMIYAYNPPKNPNAGVNTWVAEMEKRQDVKHVHVTYLDVPAEWLGRGLIESAEILLATDERQYRWLWLGEVVGIDDLIYHMFDKLRHIRDPILKAYRHIYIGVDYGQMNATTFQAFGLNHVVHTLDGLDEYYHRGRDGRQKSPSDYGSDLAEMIKALSDKYCCREFFVYIDPSAKGLAEEAKRATIGLGINVRIRNAKNDVKLGISRVQKLFTFSRLCLSPNQKNAIDEIGKYEYDIKSIERGDEKPLKINDHAMDAIRYMVMGAWQQLKPYLPETEKEKEAA